MRCFVLFAALHWFGITAFSQSMPVTPAAAQASPNTTPSRQLLFNYNTSQLAPISPAVESSTDSCSGLIAGQNQPRENGYSNQIFHVPCFNPKTLLEIAEIDVTARHNRLLEPIPTQWPDAKIEQIPVTWPDLNTVPISPAPALAKQLPNK
jgi:hypothetical protein